LGLNYVALFLIKFAENSVRCALNLQQAIKQLNSPLPEAQRIHLRIGISRQESELNQTKSNNVELAVRLGSLADSGGIVISKSLYNRVWQKLDIPYQVLEKKIIHDVSRISAYKIIMQSSINKSYHPGLLTILLSNKDSRNYSLIMTSIAGLIILLLEIALASNQKTTLIYASILIITFFLQRNYAKNVLYSLDRDDLNSILDFGLINSALSKARIQTRKLETGLTKTKTPAKQNSLAVLRFRDLSQNQEQTYFSDGLTEELINVLSASPLLEISSRTTIFSFTYSGKKALSFAKKLDVDYFVHGNVNKKQNRTLVYVELVEVKSAIKLWSKNYDLAANAIFDIQNDIYNNIADTLEIQLNLENDKDSLTSDPRAYDFYLRGRAFFTNRGIENTQYAIQMFTIASRIDPNFIRAWTDLAETYALQAMYYDGGAHSRKKSKEIAAKVLLLAPQRGETYVALGMAHLSNKEFALAAERFEKAIELDSDLFAAYHNYARTHYHQGNFKQAIFYFEKAADVDPTDFESYSLAAPLYTALGNESGAKRAYQLGITRIEKYIKEHPDNQRSYQLGAIALLKLGKLEKANDWAKQALSIAPDDPATLYNIACFYAQAGKLDQALDCLEHSITSRSWIENDPELEPLRSSPRYHKILSSLSDK